MSREEAFAHLKDGRPRAAVALLELHLSNAPLDAIGWFLLGACRHALNELPQSEASFARSLELDPAHVQAHLGYIAVLRDAGNVRGALRASQKALATAPANARFAFAAGLCLEDIGDLNGALTYYDSAIGLEPDFEDALHNRGLLLAKLGRHREAAANHQQYLSAHPQAVRAHSGLADFLLAEGEYSRVVEILSSLLQLLPQNISALIRRGVAHASLGQFTEATKDFDQACQGNEEATKEYLGIVTPNSDRELMLSPENIFLNRAWARLGHCDWSTWNQLTSELKQFEHRPAVALEPAVGFIALHAPINGRQRTAVCAHIARRIESRVPVLPKLAPQRHSRIRIGVLTPDIRDHVMAYMLAPLFELIDQDRFAITAYSIAPDDGSAIRARIRRATGTFKDLSTHSDVDAALEIQKDDIDILIDPAGHTTGARFTIMAHRPARLHVNYLGFSGSLGSSRIDYAIADRVMGSESGEWTEARAFLPHTFILYDFRDTEPQTAPTRHEYGLPADAMVYCAFHKAEKISPDIFDIWMEILRLVPHSVLWFRSLPDAAIWRLRQKALSQGVDSTRLVFAPYESNRNLRYLGRHALGDLLLDAPYHNAINSSCDALRMGLPVLSQAGTAMASRACTSLLKAAQLPELVVRDAREYAEAAVRYGKDPALLYSVKERLRAKRRTAPLFDTAGRVRELEAAFQGMYDRMMRGEPPASFDVRL